MKFRNLVKARKKLQGTVDLLRQSLLVMLATALLGLLLSHTLSYHLGLIIFGVSIFAIGGTIIAFRRIIWDDYVRSHRNKSGLLGFLTSPTRAAYWLNVIVVWPLVMLLGVAAVILGVTASQ